MDQEHPPRTISVSSFKAHCTEELRIVERKGVSLLITRHGKPVALVQPLRESTAANLGDLMGSASDLVVIADDAALDEPTWAEDDWDMHGNEEQEP